MPVDLTAILLGIVVVNSCVLQLPASAGRQRAGRHPDFGLLQLALLLPPTVALASASSWLIADRLLLPWHLAELGSLLLVVSAALFAQLIARLWRRALRLQDPPPRALLTFNAAAACLAQEAALAPDGLSGALGSGLWTGTLLGILILCFTSLCRKLDQNGPASALAGPGIKLISAGLLSLGLSGLAGFWRG